MIKDQEHQNRLDRYGVATDSGITRTTLVRYKSQSGVIATGKKLVLLAKILNVSIVDALLMDNNDKKDLALGK